MNISNRIIRFSSNTIFLHLTKIEKSRVVRRVVCSWNEWGTKTSLWEPDCGCDIVFDCLNGRWCCKVNYWVFVMTVFAVYSLIVLIVPCLGYRDMRAESRGAHNISGSREIIQSNTNTTTHCLTGRQARLTYFYEIPSSWETGKDRNA